MTRTRPLERVVDAAELVSLRDPDNLPILIEWLTDSVEPIRYWAALGCVMLRERAAPARGALTGRLD